MLDESVTECNAICFSRVLDNTYGALQELLILYLTCNYILCDNTSEGTTRGIRAGCKNIATSTLWQIKTPSNIDTTRILKTVFSVINSASTYVYIKSKLYFQRYPGRM